MAALAVADQTRLFLTAFGFGFLLGILYDVFRILRLLVTTRSAAAFVQDMLYFLSCAVLTFFFFLAVNDGELRGYMLFGQALGWIVYYFSFGSFVVRLSNGIIRAVRRFFVFLFHMICKPLRVFRKVFGKIGGKIGESAKKSTKNFRVKSKYLLKQEKALLYNLKGTPHTKKRRLRKETTGHEEAEEKT